MQPPWLRFLAGTLKYSLSSTICIMVFLLDVLEVMQVMYIGGSLYNPADTTQGMEHVPVVTHIELPEADKVFIYTIFCVLFAYLKIFSELFIHKYLLNSVQLTSFYFYISHIIYVSNLNMFMSRINFYCKDRVNM